MALGMGMHAIHLQRYISVAIDCMLVAECYCQNSPISYTTNSSTVITSYCGNQSI